MNVSPMKPCKNPTSELPSSHIWVGLCLQLTSSQRIMNLSRDKHSANDVVLMVCNSPPSCQHVYFSLSTLWMSHLSSFHNPNTLQNTATTCPPVHVFTTFSFSDRHGFFFLRPCSFFTSFSYTTHNDPCRKQWHLSKKGETTRLRRGRLIWRWKESPR